MASLDPWQRFADAVLAHEGLTCRVGRGVPPRDFAGLYVDDAEVDRILRELPGLDGPSAASVGYVAEATAAPLTRARALLHESLDQPSAFNDIVRTCGLSQDAAEVLALLAAIELDPQRQRLVAYVQDSIHLPRATLALLRRAFPPGHAGARAVAPGAPLRRSALVGVEGEGPWALRMAAPAPRLSWALVGDSSLDPGLPAGAEVVEIADVPGSGTSLLLVPGGDRESRLRLAFARCSGRRFLVTTSPRTPESWDALVREATVAGLAVVLELDREPTPEARDRITESRHLAWALLSPHELALAALPRRDWVEARPEAITVGSGHRLTREQVALVGSALPALDGDVDAAVRRLASGQLDGLAARVRPRRGWNDLVLPPDHLRRLHELAARYRHRELVHDTWGFGAVPSAGLVAVFAGPSGTGKTLAAEVLAGDLGLDLYRIDLSSVVSKYIGETEKNLERIFSAASAGMVLFFDEADALFGKRSDVGDAHDRYANIEVSYLLQRLESHDGLVVLATNLQRNMDQAFVRRIHVAVEFALPDEDARRAIWALSFPSAAPTSGLDVDFLAKQFKLSGGSIRNASVAAGFLAAEAGTPITMDVVMLALKREFQKLGRLRTEAEFERYFDLVSAEPAAPAWEGAAAC